MTRGACLPLQIDTYQTLSLWTWPNSCLEKVLISLSIWEQRIHYWYMNSSKKKFGVKFRTLTFAFYQQRMDTSLLRLKKEKWVGEKCMMGVSTSKNNLPLEASRFLEVAVKLDPAIVLNIKVFKILFSKNYYFRGSASISSPHTGESRHFWMHGFALLHAGFGSHSWWCCRWGKCRLWSRPLARLHIWGSVGRFISLREAC